MSNDSEAEEDGRVRSNIVTPGQYDDDNESLKTSGLEKGSGDRSEVITSATHTDEATASRVFTRSALMVLVRL